MAEPLCYYNEPTYNLQLISIISNLELPQVSRHRVTQYMNKFLIGKNPGVSGI